MFDKLIDVLLQFLRLFQFWEVLEPWQKGVRLRLGKFHAVLNPGFSWMAPMGIDRAVTENVVLETLQTNPQSLTTKDDKQIVVSAVITFRIDNIVAFLLEVEGRNTIIQDSACGVISDFIMKRTWEELNAITDIGNELAKVIRRKAKPYGAEVVTVQLVNFARVWSIRMIDSQTQINLNLTK